MAARRGLAASSSAIRKLLTGPSAELQNPLAFVFDIDGVLIRGGNVLPEAKQAMALLYGRGKAPRFPICFLTNGGGVTEEYKAQELSEWLSVPVDSSQVVLSHTPFRELAGDLAERPVLVAGRKQTPAVARHYGYEHAISTCELAEAFPHAVPFSLSVKGTAKQQGAGVRGVGTDDSPIEAVLIFTDPVDWYKDLQLIHDVITSGGVLGRQPAAEHVGQVKLYFSNPDLLWANEFPTGRFGQGAFHTALAALHQEVMGVPLANAKVFGKPHPEPYHLAEALLRQQAASLSAGHAGGGKPAPFGSIIAVGDNPASDIAGAIAAGRPWSSMLVRTGVFQGAGNNDRHPADFVFDDVLAAVKHALSSCT